MRNQLRPLHEPDILSLIHIYDDLTDAIIDLLDELRGDIGIHNRNFDKDGRNWGYIGDLEHVKSLLRQAHNFLNNIDEA